MINIYSKKHNDTLHGRTLYSSRFILDIAIKNKILLDIGCGYGWFELNALDRGASKIIAMELTNKDLETAKTYITNNKINFRIGSAINLPFRSNYFDTVVAWEVLEHIPKNTENQMFKEVRRVLKNNGVFYISTPNNSFFSKIFDPAWWLLGHRHYSKEQLYKFAQNNGFNIEKCEVKGNWWEIIRMIDLYVAKWIFHKRPFLNKLYYNEKKDNSYIKKKGYINLFIKLRKYTGGQIVG